MKRSFWALIILLLLAGGLKSAPFNKDILLNVVTPPLAWGDSKLDQKLMLVLSRKPDMRIVSVSNNKAVSPEFPRDYYDTDSLLNWGREVGGRYLMFVEISSERLEKRKSFHLPLVFHKYETVGVIEGELRFIDLMRGKLLAAEPFKIEQKGTRIFQATMDDNINDPDLHLTAPDKIHFFDKLEDKLSQYLAKRVRRLAGGR